MFKEVLYFDYKLDFFAWQDGLEGLGWERPKVMGMHHKTDL
jgi:hypothetical protein